MRRRRSGSRRWSGRRRTWSRRSSCPASTGRAFAIRSSICLHFPIFLSSYRPIFLSSYMCQFTSIHIKFTSILPAGLLGECLLSTSSDKGLSSFFFFILVTFCDVTNHLDRAPGVKLRSRRRSNRTRSVCRLHRRSGLRKAFGFCRNLCNFAFQFFLEPELHVFDRNSHKLLHRLEGHEYGGQAVRSIKI